ncbi:MAG: hypothetical protein NXI10_02485 [bacterium]|nr:hypothetical protein [bacterium]
MYVGINQRVAPIKFCFLTRPNSKKSFDSAVGLSCALWGGFYSPIIPLYKNLSESFINGLGISVPTETYYYNTLDNYNVDVIVYDDTLSEELVKEISDDRNIISFTQFKDKLIRGHSSNGIDIFQLLECLNENEFKYVRNDSLKISLPTFNKNALLIRTTIGALNEDIHKKINERFKDSKFYENPRIKQNYKPSETRLNAYGPYEISMYKLSIGREQGWYRASAIYVIKNNDLIDIQNFWNLRALGWNLIPLPIEELSQEYIIKLTCDFIEWYVRNEGSTVMNILNVIPGIGINSKDAKKLNAFLNTCADKSKLKVQFANYNWKPRYWEDYQTLDADKAVSCFQYSSNEYDQHEVDHDYIRFEANDLPFKIENHGFRDTFYKVEIEMSFNDDSFLKAGAISDITTADWNSIVGTYDRKKWRLTSKKVFHYVRSGDRRIQFQIPSAKDFYTEFFKHKGKTLEIHSNGKLAEEVIKNLGGLRGAYFLGKIETFEIISLFENGKVIEHQPLIGTIKRTFKNNNNGHVESLIYTLLDDKIIELGAQLKCTVCHQKSFFLPNQLQNTMTCNVCRRSFELPSYNPNEIKWAYRGIGPFSRNNKVGGLMTVFLCLNLFKRELADMFGALTPLAGFELKQEGKEKLEVDLATLIKRSVGNDQGAELLLCECKTFNDFEQEDFNRMKMLGDDIPGSTLVFATLKDKLTKFEKDQLKLLVDHYRKGNDHRPINSIMILTRKELMPSEVYDALNEYESQMHAYHRNEGFISNLSELTLKKHLKIKTWGEVLSDKWEEHIKKSK